MKTFGEKLAIARERKDLNRSELARRIGLSPQRITQIEAGTGEMKVEPFLKALIELDVNADYFIQGQEFAISRSRFMQDLDIREAISLLEATDKTGRAIALSHIKTALMNYKPRDVVESAA